MPDLTHHEKYTKSINAKERKLKGALKSLLWDARSAMIDKVMTEGLSSAALPRLLRSDLEALKAGADKEAVALLPEVIEASELFVSRQLEDLRQFDEQTPAMEEIQTLVYAGLGELVTGDQMGWVSTFEGRMLGELRRMSNTGESSEEAVRRLFSPQIVDGRASVYRHTVNSSGLEAGLLVWSAANGSSGLLIDGASQLSGLVYKKQVVAAIDERTTDTCLQAHGQIQVRGKPFKLVGTPRFADHMMRPPFHYNCRTSVSLYTEALEGMGVTTAEMVSAARAEIEARPGRKEIHPAHATSRR